MPEAWLIMPRHTDRKSSEIVRLLDSPDLTDLPTPLLNVATAPERCRTDAGKQQSSWAGGVILSALRDDRYEPNRTALALDLWAVRRSGPSNRIGCTTRTAPLPSSRRHSRLHGAHTVESDWCSGRSPRLLRSAWRLPQRVRSTSHVVG